MKPKKIYHYITVVSLSFFWVLNLPQAWGETVTTIRDNGDPSNRVDFVILGDGYMASELTKYANDVENAVNGFFSQEPFKEYQKYFNVHRVDVISNESGVDHPPEYYKDTAFDGTYNCAGIQRLICVNYSKVDSVLINSVNPDQRDMILVLVNDTEYGGSGGALAVASTHASCIELVLHEIGHSFGLLADEYDYGTCSLSVEPSQPNVTMETNRDLIKWNIDGGPPAGWIEPTTLLPTFTAYNGIPGLYEGAQYCSAAKYRPTYNSKMRSLNGPFEQINEEQLVKRVYNWVSPLDSSTPPGAQLMLGAGESQLFEVQVLEPLTHAIDVKWYVDDQFESDELQFIFDSTIFGQGPHTVKVVLRDYTSKVRYDPTNVLIEQRIWDVAVESLSQIFFDDYQDQNFTPTVGSYVQLSGTNTVVDRGDEDYWLQNISGVVQASPTTAAEQVYGSYDFAIDTNGTINSVAASHHELNLRPIGISVGINWGADGGISWYTNVPGGSGPYGESHFTWNRGTDYHIMWSIDAVADTVSFSINDSPILDNLNFGGDFTHLYGLVISNSAISDTDPLLIDNVIMYLCNDLSVFATDYGRTECGSGSICEGDFDRDGDCDGFDLAALAEGFDNMACPMP